MVSYSRLLVFLCEGDFSYLGYRSTWQPKQISAWYLFWLV